MLFRYPRLPFLQVGPFLKELALYTKVGPTLRRLKIDVDYIISSAGAHTIGTLLEKVWAPGWGRGPMKPALGSVERPSTSRIDSNRACGTGSSALTPIFRRYRLRSRWKGGRKGGCQDWWCNMQLPVSWSPTYPRSLALYPPRSFCLILGTFLPV